MKFRALIPALLLIALAIVVGLPRFTPGTTLTTPSAPAASASYTAAFAPLASASVATPAPADPVSTVAAPAATAAPLDPAVFFGVTGPVTLADIPDSPFRTSLLTLSAADRAPPPSPESHA